MGAVYLVTGAVPELMGAVYLVTGAVPELMGAAYLVTGAVSLVRLNVAKQDVHA